MEALFHHHNNLLASFWSLVQEYNNSNYWWAMTAVLLIFWPVLLSFVMFFVTAGTWIFWLCTSILLGIVQTAYAVYQFSMIAIDIFGLSLLKTYAVVRHSFLHWVWWERWNSKSTNAGKSRRKYWRHCLEQAGTYENFLKIRIHPKVVPLSFQSSSSSSSDTALPRHSSEQDLFPNHHNSNNSNNNKKRYPRSRSFHAGTTPTDLVDPQVAEELGDSTAQLLVTITSRLEQARLAFQQNPSNPEHWKAFSYLLSSVVKRNYLNLDDLSVENARSIADTGSYGLSMPTRQVIRAYYEQVDQALDYLAEAPMPTHQQQNSAPEETTTANTTASDAASALAERLLLVKKMKQNMGRTALMLSGGGAQAMYHMGLIRALIESKLYQDIKVVSGTSGGSILAAVRIPHAILVLCDLCQFENYCSLTFLRNTLSAFTLFL